MLFYSRFFLLDSILFTMIKINDKNVSIMVSRRGFP